MIMLIICQNKTMKERDGLITRLNMKEKRVKEIDMKKKKIFKKNEDYFKFINANEIEIEEVRVKGDSIILFYGRKDGREINKRN